MGLRKENFDVMVLAEPTASLSLGRLACALFQIVSNGSLLHGRVTCCSARSSGSFEVFNLGFAKGTNSIVGDRSRLRTRQVRCTRLQMFINQPLNGPGSQGMEFFA